MRLRYLVGNSPTDDRQRVSSEVSEVSFLPMEHIGEQGSLDLSLVRDRDDVKKGYTEFHDGDVLVAKITPCFENGKGALARGLLNGVGYGTTELHVLSPGPMLDGRFLYYVTASDRFRKLGEAEMSGAAGQKRVPEDFIRNYRIAVPSLSEQRSIVGFLDRETARLDSLVTAKERLLASITEKRRALIIRAVTRGLDDRVAVRDSGVSWLGKVPVHWETRRNAWLFRERDERGEPELPLLEVSINRGVMVREFASDRIESTAADFNSYKVARKGDVVFNKMRMWQGAVGIAPVTGLVSPDYVVAVIVGPITQEYTELLLRTDVVSAECARHSHGIVWDRLRLYWEGFREVVLPLPPKNEQEAIVAWVASETAKLDALRAAAERTLTLLGERRGALITAAVMGQVRIAEAG
jgi:type I restriction enzyme S subunit